MIRLSGTFREPAVMSVRYRILSLLALAIPLRQAAAQYFNAQYVNAQYVNAQYVNAQYFNANPCASDLAGEAYRKRVGRLIPPRRL